MKGRIIGREGAISVPLKRQTVLTSSLTTRRSAVLISGFDPFRREVAKISLERLMTDGRIHPARIEEIVEKRQRNSKMKFDIGENSILELGFTVCTTNLCDLLGA